MGHTKKPTLNSETNYGGDGTGAGWRAPAIREGETIVYDEEGRCSPQVNGKGGIDFHSHHFRVFKSGGSSYRFAVKHGGGEESFTDYNTTRMVDIMAGMDSDSRFLTLHALFDQRGQGESMGRNENEAKWRLAAADKRIKTRKMPGRDSVKVWIEPKRIEAVAKP